MKRPLIVLGAGGHAKVLIEALRLGSAEVLGIADVDPSRSPVSVLGIPVLGGDDVLAAHPPTTVELVNGIGSISVPHQRQRVFLEYLRKGYAFATVIHPSAVVASDVQLADGVQLMAGAVIQPGVRIGRDCIVNTRSSIDHDCVLGDHVHVAPGATLSGGIVVGDCSHIGIGAVIIQGVRIGANSVVGAGAVVLNDVLPEQTVIGVPARAMRH